jgi:hypothetical protein
MKDVSRIEIKVFLIRKVYLMESMLENGFGEYFY